LYHPKQMSHANALCSFTSYELWNNKDVTPAAGGEWNRVWPFWEYMFNFNCNIDACDVPCFNFVEESMLVLLTYLLHGAESFLSS